MRYGQSCENAKLMQNHKICAFLVYYIRSPLSTLSFYRPDPSQPTPDLLLTYPCPYATPYPPLCAYKLSPIPFSVLPCPVSLLNHTPPLIRPRYPRSILFIPPHIRLSHILAFPQSCQSTKNACASLTHPHQPTHTFSIPPFPTIYTFPTSYSPIPIHTPQLITTHIFALL